jgi:hypothetical protein
MPIPFLILIIVKSKVTKNHREQFQHTHSFIYIIQSQHVTFKTVTSKGLPQDAADPTLKPQSDMTESFQ